VIYYSHGNSIVNHRNHSKRLGFSTHDEGYKEVIKMTVNYWSKIQKGDNASWYFAQLEGSEVVFERFPYSYTYLCSSGNPNFGIPVRVSYNDHKQEWYVIMTEWNTDNVVVNREFSDADRAFIYATKLAEKYLYQVTTRGYHLTQKELKKWDWQRFDNVEL
jgi:hypothetical protein